LTRSNGLVELLNNEHEPMGAREPCTFEWEVTPSIATVRWLTDHEWIVSAAEGEVSYVVLRADDGSLLFMLRVPEHIVENGVFGIGPHRSGFI
jgi:hypothetical protein